MKNFLLIIFLLFLFLHINNSQKAIVFSSSIGYYNYRQTANAFSVYHKLKQFGFTDDDIILMIAQNSGCCQKNPHFGSVSFIDNDYTNINKNIQIDYDYTDINLESVFNTFRMKFKSNTIQKNLFTIPNKPQPLFIYITGHGGNQYFKIRQRQAIIDQNFKILVEDLIKSKRFSQIFLISDSCSAITPFQTINSNNFTAFGSSSFDQKSQSHGYDQEMNSPKSDDFTFYLIEFLQNNDPRKKIISLRDLFNYMSYDRLNVHSKIVGKGKRYLKTINHFFIKKRNIMQKTFLLQNSF